MSGKPNTKDYSTEAALVTNYATCPSCERTWKITPASLFYYSSDPRPIAQCASCAKPPTTRGGTKSFGSKRDQISPGKNTGINSLASKFYRRKAREKARRDRS